MEQIMRQQDCLLDQVRKSERALRNELQQVKKSAVTDLQRYQEEELLLIETNQKLSAAEHSIAAEIKRNVDLKSRCDDLLILLDQERKLR